MKKSFVFLSTGIFLLMSHALKASFQEYAKERQQKDMNKTKITPPNKIPGFITASPPETQFNNSQTLKSATESAFNLEHAQTLKRIAETRPYFVVDSEKDPLVANSTDSMKDPEKVLKAELTNKKPRTEYIFKTCQEAKPAIEFTCHKTLVPPTVHIEPALYSQHLCRVARHQPDDPHCKAKVYYPTPRKYRDEKVNISPEVWNSDCGVMEQETKKRTCKLIKKDCPHGPETREVMATVGPQYTPQSYQLKRDCWRYEYTYECSYPSPNTCDVLRKSSCEQIKSRCFRELEGVSPGVCVEWEQTYRCLSQVNEKDSTPKDKISTGAFSLPPPNAPPPLTPNHDMADAISKLSVLKEIQDNMREYNEKIDVNSIRIFKGTSNKCTIAFGNFKNCCTDGKGWGVSLHLSGCEDEDKILAEKQQNKLCVEIGTYCAEKVLGVCIRKKKSYCCFGTKLARILHVQGRPQLGMGWGKPKHPECRGFTIEELSCLNFDEMDLSELFSEIAAKTKQITQTTVNVVTRNLTDRVSQMTKDIKPGFKPTFTTNGVKPHEMNKPKTGDF